jgi:hypothetical protein
VPTSGIFTYCKHFKGASEWDDDMKIFALDWNQYDQFCYEYQKDKVATMPAPAVPIGYEQPMDPITRWDKGVRQDSSNFPILSRR